MNFFVMYRASLSVRNRLGVGFERIVRFSKGKVSAHDWHNVAEFAAPYLLWDLPDPLYFTTMGVFSCLKSICARSLVVRDLPALKARLIETWCRLSFL